MMGIMNIEQGILNVEVKTLIQYFFQSPSVISVLKNNMHHFSKYSFFNTEITEERGVTKRFYFVILSAPKYLCITSGKGIPPAS